jgi:hypothetical protein
VYNTFIRLDRLLSPPRLQKRNPQHKESTQPQNPQNTSGTQRVKVFTASQLWCHASFCSVTILG